MTGWHPITVRYLLAVERLNKRTARAEARALVLEEENAELVAEVCRLAEDSEKVRADAELLLHFIPREHRKTAMAMVRTRRTIDRLEVAGG